MTQILRGKDVAEVICHGIMDLTSKMKGEGITPTLAVVRMGEKQEDLAYEASVVKKAVSLGIQVKKWTLKENETQEQLEVLLRQVNDQREVDGILLFRPLPMHIDDDRIRNLISPEKDIDGISDLSMSGVYGGKKGVFGPCTAESVLAILKHYSVPMAGKKAVVLGRSLVIGKPVAMLLLQENATVTLCHRGTEDLPEECKRADILVVAAGKAGIADKTFFRPGQTVLDVGIHVNDRGELTGDVVFQDAQDVVSAITPVPGGVGTVTTAILMDHLTRSAQRRWKG